MKKGYRYRWFLVFACVFLVLGILVTTVGNHFSVVLTAALEGSTTDEERAEETYAAGLEMNLELEEEGIVLLKNDDNTLPMEDGKVNLFGNCAVNLVYNGSGSSAGNAVGAVTLKEGLEEAGLNVNEDLWELIEGNSQTSDTSVHEGNEVDLSNYQISEMSTELYTGDCSFENLKAYSDTAIVCIGRSGGEGQDLPRTGLGEEGNRHYLELCKQEEELLRALHENGFKIIVLINTSYAMELGFLEHEEYGISAALWIGGPGIAGAQAVGETLRGEVNPSGRLADTYAYDLTTQSSFITSDYYYYMDAADTSKQLGGFTNYSEGIYVGYRWYETADAEGYWDNVSNEYGNGYDGVVQYPFGYGLSYTEFEQTIESVDSTDGVYQFKVAVENTGDTAGKDVIQIYAETPYTNGGTEKSKVVLCAFSKTGLLEPGETGTYTLEVSEEDLASYDKNIDGGTGAYTLDKGEYVFYLSENAHTWAQADKKDAEKCYSVIYDEAIVYSGENGRASDEVTAQNQFKEAEGGIALLSRTDGFANAKETIFSEIEDIVLETDNPMYQRLVTDASKAGKFQGKVGNITTGAEKRFSLADLYGAEFDDERWDELISQMSVGEMNELIGTGGWSTIAVSSIDKPKTTDIDGPFGLSNYIQNELGNSESVCVSYCSEVVVASTWNTELIERYGETVGDEANATGVSGWYAPGANLHRSSFGGRNPEYYSEDSFLSGEVCAAMVKGAVSRGLYTYMKHFGFNDQEANRTSKENCWMTEQTAREIYLKPFETAVKEGSATGLMVSYMWFEGEWCGGNYNLITGVVRNEWGFDGVIVTDNYCAQWMNPTKAIMAGTDLILSNAARSIDEDVMASNEGITAMKTACHHILYTIANAAGNREIAAQQGFDYWNLIYIGGQFVLYGGTVVFAVIFFMKRKKAKKMADS